jgi:hypothetical protein
MGFLDSTLLALDRRKSHDTMLTSSEISIYFLDASRDTIPQTLNDDKISLSDSAIEKLLERRQK